MAAELELTIVQPGGPLGYVAAFAITDELVHVAGGTSAELPIVMASSNARRFERLTTPRELGLRGIAVLRDEIWICGEFGQLARSSDRGASWTVVPTRTDDCMFALAAVGEELWVAGDRGFCVRIRGDVLEPVELGTTSRLASVYEHGSDVVIVCRDGVLRRWRDGAIQPISVGTATPLTGLAITKRGTWIAVGDRGFITRSPDGAWFTRVASGTDADLESVALLSDGRIVVVGDRGTILVSSDDGRTWQPHASDLAAHLWSVTRFGDGVLIGGDGGLIARLAPPGDAAWADRPDVFGDRDAWIADGPDGFIESRLSTYLEDEHEDGGDDGDDDGDDDDDDDDDDSDGDGDDDGGDGDDNDTDGEVFQTRAFAATYGTEVPPELATLARVLAGRRAFGLVPRWSAPRGNLFERLVTRDQRDPRATGLVEAFSGVVQIGRSHYLELYGWDAPRQVLRFDRDTQRFAVVADSLDSFAYAAAVAGARLDGDRAELAARALAGRVVPLDPERRDTEFLLCRSRWLRALFRGVATVGDMFDPDLNQVVPADQLRARLAACERYVPTALYSLWRAFWFDEPDRSSYLEVARAHRARLVRDAAALVDELLAGRNELGSIRDVRAHLARFRALGLEPRRASRTADDVVAAPRDEWTELAWRSLDDADAHRALLQQPALAGQVAALAGLRDLAEPDRRIALAKLASELEPELEAVLVGSLVRGGPRLRVVPTAVPAATARDGEDRVRAALRMSERAMRVTPEDPAIQLAHAMRMIEAEAAGCEGKVDALLRALPALEPIVRVRVAVRLAGSPRAADALDAALAAADELAADQLCALADAAARAGARSQALALFEHLLALPIPDGGGERRAYVRALDQARALEAYDIAARIADRAQPIAHENPDLFHSAARAYAAVGEYAKAFEQVKLAFEHGYVRLGQVETDEHLGPVRELPEFKALFLDWHARQEGN